MVIQIIRLHDLPLEQLSHLVKESEASGHRFVGRLVAEWQSGLNRFSHPGEALFAAMVESQIVAVCGLNQDPYAGDARVGRVRHVYVLKEFRRRGIGRRLIEQILNRARGTFDRLRLRTAAVEASRFYESLGFRASANIPECTHFLDFS
jgi:GNAT superfamily N-acetyltransferase